MSSAIVRNVDDLAADEDRLFSVRASGLSLRSRFSTPNGHFLPSSNGYCHTKFLDKKLQIRHLDNLCVCGNSHTDWRPGYSNDDGSTHDSAVHFEYRDSMGVW